MKKKNFWTKTSLLMIIPITTIVGSSIFYLSSNNQPIVATQQTNKIPTQNLNIKQLKNRSLTGEVTEKVSTFQFKQEKDIPWWGKKKTQFVTTADLTIAVVPENIDAVYKIEIQNPEPNDYLNGIVRFKIIQSIRTFKDGVVTSFEDKEIAVTPTSGGNNGSTTPNVIWETPKGLVVEDKYKFSWRSKEDIGDFLSKITLKPDDLTVEIVLNNLVLQDDLHKVPKAQDVSIQMENLPQNSNSKTQYGVTKLVISFTNGGNLTTNWVGGTLPSQDERTIILRGLVTSNGNKETMTFNSTKLNIEEFKKIEIDSTNKKIFGNVLLDTENKLIDLTPSEFININSGNQNSLIDLFTTGKYLKVTVPIVGLYYMGLFTTNSNFDSQTSLISGESKVTKIEAEPNDLDGSLKLIFQYSYYDVFYSKITNQSYSYEFPANTFKINLDAKKTLSFNWKQDSAIANTFGSSHSIVNQFKQLTNDQEKAAFSNQFFNGSSDAYAKVDREITIDYKGGSKIENGVWVPKSSNDLEKKTVEISIYFKTWNGLVTDKQGTIVDGFYTTTSFVLPTYEYTEGKVMWKNQKPIDIENKLASDVAYSLGKNLISQDQFFTTSGFNSVSAVFFPDDTIGTLRVRVIGTLSTNSQQFYENTFVGFKKSFLADSVVQIGWLPQTSVSSNLLDKGINQVTKTDVITLLTNSNNLFANSILTENDIDLTRDYDRNVIVARVTITFFNQDLPSVTRTQSFVTEIVGFSSTRITDSTVLPTPANITLIASVAAGGAVALVLLSILTYQIVRSVRFSLAKKSAKAKEGV